VNTKLLEKEESGMEIASGPYGQVPPWELDTRIDLPVIDDAVTVPDIPVVIAAVTPPVARPRWQRVLLRYPLALILVVQAALSLRLVWSNTPYPDEALYLSAGHLEISHWFHSTLIPAFPTYFSGAPVVYPPIGALADTIGGLTGARSLSLIFMLIATSCAYGTTRRIFDQRSAWFAAALFAATGSSQYLGAFATYDAMALMLLTVSTWLGVCAAANVKVGRFVLLVCSAAILAAADAAKYAATLFDPIVIIVIMLAVWRISGRNAALRAIIFVLSGLILIIDISLHLGGHAYWEGITFTTLTRATGTSAEFAVWWLALGWTGLVIGLSIIGAGVTMGRDRPTAWLGITLTAAVFLAPAEQARIHTITSLFKHVGFGAWFASIVAGLALATFSRVVPSSKAAITIRLSITVIVSSFILGTALAWNQFHSWPNASVLITKLQSVMNETNGPVLIGDNGYFAYYYMRNESTHHQFWGAGFAKYSELLGNNTIANEYQDNKAIRNGFFKVVVLSLRNETWIDRVTESYMKASGRYKMITVLQYNLDHGSYEIWLRKGNAR
jgi:4-amino-4-deoxy-L-arabinose transferase-like glycosyltransferase